MKRNAIKNKYSLRPVFMLALVLILTASFAAPAYAAPEDVVQSLFGEDAQTLDIVILLTVITLLPTLLIMLTGFMRIVIVLGFVRTASGQSNTPPNIVLIGLALFLTYFVMSPVINEIYQEAYVPYVEEEISLVEMGERASVPLKEFMLKQTYDSDLEFFAGIDRMEQVDDITDVPMRVVIPAFLTSELKHAFQIGFFIYIPFIVIDMIVASTLMAMGMMMLPPAMISAPFKILLFVMVDGWQLTIGTLINSFR